LKDGSDKPVRADRRLDQWLWFARLTRSRSQAARLAAAGAVLVNGVAVCKGSLALHIGDAVVVPQGPRRRAVRVLALGTRRGPAVEARLLYEETAWAATPDRGPSWVPLLFDGDGGSGDP
jgi:ribosome-associated heat shock protein Hsp15